MANTPGLGLGEDGIRRIAEKGEDLYSLFRAHPMSDEEAREVLLSLAVAGGGTLLVGLGPGGDISGVGGHEIGDVVAALKDAASVVDAARPHVNAAKVDDRWVAYVLLGEFQPGAHTAKLPSQGFDELSAAQRRLAVALDRALTSGNYRSEAMTTVTHNKGWAVLLIAPDQTQNREILGFEEMDLHALADESYIRLLPTRDQYKIAVTQKTGRECQRAIAALQPAARADESAPHIFVSYLREDRETVDRLCDDLRSAGLHVWLDREKIVPGERWKVAIRRAIEEGAYFLACFSGAYSRRDKSYMNEELVLAIEQLRQRPVDRSWFIPIRLDDCEVPDRTIGGGERLNDLQWVDLFPDWDEAVKGLLCALVDDSRKRK